MTPAELAALKLLPVRHSRLRQMDRSAAHYAEGSWEETGPMRKGTALHAYLLGQPDRVAVYTEGNRDERQAKYRAFQQLHAGKTILSPSEFAVAEAMRNSVLAHPVAMQLLTGVQEQPIYWDHNGRRCLSTPDVVQLHSDRKVLTELKACSTSQPERFMWHAKRMRYHSQLAFYSTALERSTVYAPTPVTERYIVAVEMTAPHPVTIIRMGDSMLSLGQKTWRRWFEMLQNCERAEHFPGYVESIVTWEDDEPDPDLGGGDGLDWEDAAAE